jgi:hypothetical protein
MKLIKSFLVALVGSVVANLVILFALKNLVVNPAMPLHALSVPTVTALSTVGVIGAFIVYAIMRAVMKNPNMAFIWIAVIVLLVSFVPDYMVIGMTTGPFAGGNLGSALTLALMHVVEAIIVVYSLVKIWGARMPKVAPPPAPAPLPTA